LYWQVTRKGKRGHGEPISEGGWFRRVRIGLLAFVLFLVAGSAWLDHHRLAGWDRPVWVTLYPIVGDHTAVTGDYVASLRQGVFDRITAFFQEEAVDYGVAALPPVEVRLAPAVAELPPAPPAPPAGVAATAAWSLRLRWWAHRVDTFRDPPADIRIFLIYHELRGRVVLDSSLGLEKGRIGVVHCFASRRMAPTNNVIIAHELLHTLGATDKYDPATNLPRFPDGFADPGRQPRYPQVLAEVMGGRIPLRAGQAKIPPSLDYVVIGEATAREIGWLR